MSGSQLKDVIVGVVIGSLGVASISHVVTTYFDLRTYVKQYGSYRHAFTHRVRHGGWGGQISHVKARLISDGEDKLVGVHGLVCNECGFVSVNRVLNDGDNTEDSIFGRHPGQFCWTTPDEIPPAPATRWCNVKKGKT